MPHISASLQSLTYSQEKNIKNRHEWHLQWFIVIRYTRIALHALCCDCVHLQTVFYVFPFVRQSPCRGNGVGAKTVWELAHKQD